MFSEIFEETKRLFAGDLRDCIAHKCPIRRRLSPHKNRARYLLPRQERREYSATAARMRLAIACHLKNRLLTFQHA
jgi:hypothetical protein